MKLAIEIHDENIDGALAEPASRYWASEAEWRGAPLSCGFVKEIIEGGKPMRHVLTPEKLQGALVKMAEKHPKHFERLWLGTYDGETGDVLLQLMAFGEVKYG